MFFSTGERWLTEVALPSAQIIAFKIKDRGGKNAYVNHVLEIFALFMLTGVGSTLLIPETKGLSLEQLSGEDQDNFIAAPHASQRPTSV